MQMEIRAMKQRTPVWKPAFALIELLAISAKISKSA